MKPARNLIVNADDYGLTAGVSRGILDSHRRGIVTSTTLLVNRPVDPALIDALKASGMGVGLHMNLTLGPPVAPAKRVASLLDGEGQVHPRRAGGRPARAPGRGAHRARHADRRVPEDHGPLPHASRLPSPRRPAGADPGAGPGLRARHQGAGADPGRGGAGGGAQARAQDAGSLHGRVGPGRVLVVRARARAPARAAGRRDRVHDASGLLRRRPRLQPVRAPAGHRAEPASTDPAARTLIEREGIRLMHFGDL